MSWVEDKRLEYVKKLEESKQPVAEPKYRCARCGDETESILDESLCKMPGGRHDYKLIDESKGVYGMYADETGGLKIQSGECKKCGLVMMADGKPFDMACPKGVQHEIVWGDKSHNGLLRIGEKCYLGTCDCFTKPASRQNDDMSELSLLIVDFGDSCAVKAEVPCNDFAIVFPFETGNEFTAKGLESWRCSERGTWLVPHCFTEIRAAIDAMDEKPPVPRLEYEETVEPSYRLITDEGEAIYSYRQWNVITSFMPQTCKAIRIYEPRKAGTWMRLPSTSEYMGDPLESIGVAIWRYTRSK